MIINNGAENILEHCILGRFFHHFKSVHLFDNSNNLIKIDLTQCLEHRSLKMIRLMHLEVGQRCLKGTETQNLSGK